MNGDGPCAFPRWVRVRPIVRSTRMMAGLVLAVTLAVSAQVQPALAADPTGDSGTPGIQIDPNGPRTPAQLGYTKAYADAKNTQFAQALKARMATFAATGGVAPMPATPALAAASGGQIGGSYSEYHEKQNTWCLPATAQSILAWKFGTSIYVGSSVLNSQTNIKGSIGNYTDDYAAFSYINGQYARWGSGFRYVPVNDKASLSAFQTRITQETDYWNAPLYVRVNVTSHYYAWWQTKLAYHATVSVGYGGSGSSVLLGDPYTDAAHTNNCQPVAGYPGYSSTSDYGCIYYGGFPTSNYWMAMTDVISGEQPEQY